MLNSQNPDDSGRTPSAQDSSVPATSVGTLRIGVTQPGGKDPVELILAKGSAGGPRPGEAQPGEAQSVIRFQKAQVDQPRYLVLNVLPGQLDSPAKLTSDNPQYFQLATDSHPTFVGSLVVKPAVDKYVHVRYTSERAGTHTGQLLVELPDAQYTLKLQARSVGLLPSLVAERKAREAKAEANSGRRWLSIGAVLLLGSLIGVGAFYRCELFPSLCSAPPAAVIERESITPTPAEPTETQPARPAPVASASDLAKVADQPTPRVVEPTLDRRADSRPAQRKPNPVGPVKQVAPAAANQESDLEKILNQE